MRRTWLALLAGTLISLGASPSVVPSAGPRPTPAPTEWPVDLEIRVQPSIGGLAVSKAIADSLEEGIRLVPIRIVERMHIAMTLLTTEGVVFSEPPVVCMYWHDAAPDDGGLESPCWGIPDPSSTLAGMLARDDGAWALAPATGVALGTDLGRGPGTCDYPPGDWVLRLRVVPQVDGVAAEPVYLRVPFEVPFDPTEVLPAVPLSDTRFCGLASEVIREQGVPPTQAP